jgi:hypothetical protein
VIPALSFAFTLVFIAVGFAVGVRLMALWRRTGGLAELTLGLGLFLIVGVGYPLILVGLGLAQSSLGTGARVLMIVASAVMNAGWVGVWIFTWRVFRPDSGLARVAAWSAIAGLAAMCGIRTYDVLVAPDLAALQQVGAGTLGTPLLAMASYLWTATEAFRYTALLRRRAAIGLGDPVVANRAFLWGCVGVSSTLSLAPSLIRQLQGHAGLEPTAQLLAAIAGLGCTVALYLAFLPPKAYVAWLRAGATTAEG